MEKWEEFEIACTDYLNEKFGDYACFIREGGHNNTVADIKVCIGEEMFYIEAKDTPAQCGQFVLLPDMAGKKFYFSPRNISSETNNTKIIQNYMNQNFAIFINANKKGKPILFDNCEKVFSSWIINYYKGKDVSFFITNGYKIVPIENFAEYFDVSAMYRIKKSGSSSVPKKDSEGVISFIKQEMPEVTIQHKYGKLNILTKEKLKLVSFTYDGNTYSFTKVVDNCCEVRKLSKTYNANVIFSIKAKEVEGLTDEEFINRIVHEKKK